MAPAKLNWLNQCCIHRKLEKLERSDFLLKDSLRSPSGPRFTSAEIRARHTSRLLRELRSSASSGRPSGGATEVRVPPTFASNELMWTAELIAIAVHAQTGFVWILRWNVCLKQLTRGSQQLQKLVW